MASPETIAWYNANAPTLVKTYQELEAERVHGWLIDLLPASGAIALDVGAGSGRDAAWLSSRGFEVIAVEPAREMRESAAQIHSSSPVRWMDDSLPDLRQVLRLGISFDFILLSAVWMHLPEHVRPRAFRKLITLLKPGGTLAISLRMGPANENRPGMHSVSESEIERLAREHGALIVRRVNTSDHQQRSEVNWVQVAIRLPDDGTGALPLLRQVILNDDKSSTYKLGLLRTISRIADSAPGYGRLTENDEVAVPLGLVGLFWLRLYKPLIAAHLPQTPTNQGETGLGFIRNGYREIRELSPLDLRIGARFTDARARALHAALRDACATIVKMPVRYLTYPSGGPVFRTTARGASRAAAKVVLDDAYLLTFGELLMPLHLWRSLQRFDAWIEPAIITEWLRLMRRYATTQGRSLSEGEVAGAMTWIDPIRDVSEVRSRVLQMMSRQTIHCVWSGQRLSEQHLDIDHCFPWSAWPCDHLWNLLPANRRINQQEKRDRLPGETVLSAARDRILEWWHLGYDQMDTNTRDRFRAEVSAGLPLVGGTDFRLEEAFDALVLQRMRLRNDQGIPEWQPRNI
jgi:SAM-dependent methyltransferase